MVKVDTFGYFSVIFSELSSKINSGRKKKETLF